MAIIMLVSFFAFGLVASVAAHDGIEIVSVNSAGEQNSGTARDGVVSADNTVVAFRSNGSSFVANDNNGDQDLFLHDTKDGSTIRINIAPGGLEAPNEGSPDVSISSNGDFVAFESSSPNLVEGDTNELDDCFLLDRRNGEIIRINLSPGGRTRFECHKVPV